MIPEELLKLQKGVLNFLGYSLLRIMPLERKEPTTGKKKLMVVGLKPVYIYLNIYRHTQFCHM